MLKQHSEIIRSLAEVVKRYPDAVYLHLGEGFLLPEEQSLAEKLGVADHVRFAGNQEKVRDYLIASDIYVMSSSREGISLSTIEAMACNIPAVLYDVEGLRDFNKEKECACLVPENPSALAEAVCSLYEDRPRQLELTRNANELIHSKYDMDKSVARIIELYKRGK